MRLRLLLSISPEDDLTAEDPYEVLTVVTKPLTAHTAYYLVTAFAPTGEQRDATQFLGNAAGYPPRLLAQLMLGALIQQHGEDGEGLETVAQRLMAEEMP
jgi:hypothetical protein